MVGESSSAFFTDSHQHQPHCQISHRHMHCDGYLTIDRHSGEHSRPSEIEMQKLSCWRERVAFTLWMVLFGMSGIFLIGIWIACMKLAADDDLGPLQVFDGARGIPIAMCALFTYFFMISLWKRARPLVRRVMAHMVLFCCVSLAQTLFANIASYLHVPGDKLFDVGFALLPELGEDTVWHKVSELLTVSAVISFALVLFSLQRDPRYKASIDWLRLMSVMYAFRALTIWWTLLPGPAPHCSPGNLDYQPPIRWVDIVTWVGPLVGKFNTCGDLLFSGHTSFVTLNALLVQKHLPISPRIKYGKRAHFLIGVYLTSLAVFIISSRKHYTVDVILGFIIATMIFSRFEHGWAALKVVYVDAGAIVKCPSTNSDTRRQHFTAQIPEDVWLESRSRKRDAREISDSTRHTDDDEGPNLEPIALCMV